MNNKYIVFCLAFWLLLPSLILAATNKSLENTEFQVFKAQTELKLDALKEGQTKAIVEVASNRDKAFEAQNKIIDAFDKRISDINFYLAIYAVLATIVAIAVSVLALFTAGTKAKESAESWFNAHEDGLYERLKNLEDNVQIHAHNAKKAMTADADALKIEKEKLQQTMMAGSSVNTAADNPQLKTAAETLKLKPEAQYTFDDWNNRAFAAVSENKLALAVEYWGKAASASDATNLEVANSLSNKGVALGKQNNYDEAITCTDEVIRRFSATDEVILQVQVANALNGKGFALLNLAKQAWGNEPGRVNQLNSALSLFEQAKTKCTDKAIVLGNVAYTLWLLERYDEVKQPLREALTLGGERLRDAELEDTKIHPIDSIDAGFRDLVNKAWEEVRPK